MIERLVRRRDVRGQFRFATEAKRRVPERDDVVLAKSHRGLHLLARNAAYGSGVEVDGKRPGKPVMEVRIGLEKQHLPAVRADLVRRGANPSVEYVGTHYCVLRFEAPLGELLGLPGELRELTRGRATHQIVLNRYEEE